MSVFKQEDAAMWTGLFAEVSKEKPAVGRVVRITRGKHTGKIGTVKRHQPSQYGHAFRYGSEASRAMQQVRGRYGFCVLVQPLDGGPTFWANANLTMICLED